jgi:hypothetical protein
MTGRANLKAKVLLPTGKEKVVHRLILQGDFGVHDDAIRPIAGH